RVTVEGTRRRELAELVPDHVLGDEHRDEIPSVVDREREPDRVGGHGAAARPGLDDLLALRSLRGSNLLGEVAVDERTLLYRTSHDVSLSALLAAALDDHAVGSLVVAG